ncbi:sigma-54-dependent Fis family transcriptional regulator [Methyloceanibacter stevinii]|nr:sigma-54-dependent Fis family transcriptional regulator [Methyloceanibacter stevinii]
MKVAATPAPPLKTGDNQNIIHRSWFRCINELHLNPGEKPAPHVETADRLSQSCERIGDFLNVARAGIGQLFKQAPDVGYVLLTDADGVVVDSLGTDCWGDSLGEAGLLAGANWHETYAGTNGIGTCIHERTALTCHHDEHFFAGNISLSCDSAPLFDATGNFMGVLNVSALPTPTSHGNYSLAAYLTMFYSQVIEGASFMRHFRDCWILRLGTASELLEVCTDMMLALDRDGTIVGATSTALRQLGGDPSNSQPQHGNASSLADRHLSEVCSCTPDEVWNMMRTQSTSERHVLTTADGQILCASVVAPRTVARTGKPQSRATTRSDYSALNELAGDDQRMTHLLDHARRLVDKQVSIFVRGETGTGKEVLARACHLSSERAGKAFIAVNCAALPETLIESELFGYTAGTFTGGRGKGKKGLIQQADGGTLFLDEIGDMPLHLQTRLLRVLSEREVLPLGASTHVPVDLTVISASHRDLRKLILEGLFREDLFYRLCGATLFLPPLRDRQDRSHIISRLLEQESQKLGNCPHIADDAMELLMRYQWPGNVRELRNALRFALAITDGPSIHAEHLPFEIRFPGAAASGAGGSALLDAPQLWETHSPPLAETDANDPAVKLRACLRQNKWNITAAAAELGLCRSSVYRQMRRFGIVPPTHI